MKRKDNQLPLISIVVVTYNSSNYILDTLKSVKYQTYPHLELIITDDSSTDNTMEICSRWLDTNRKRFINVAIISSDKNTGITANKNRGFFAANGVWIKHVDGDDILLPTCVEDYVKFVLDNPSKNMVFSPLQVFGDGDMEKWNKLLYTNFKYAFSLNPKDFKILLCKICVFPAPSLFIKADYFKNVKGYDESIRDLEDWPFWVKTAFADAQFAYISSPEVKYRINSNSLSQGVVCPNERYKKALFLVEKKNLEYMKKISLLYWLDGFMAFKKKYSKSYWVLLLSFVRLFNPYFWKARFLYVNYKRNK